MCNLFENRTAFNDLLEAFQRVRRPVLKPERGSTPNLPPLDFIRPTEIAPVLRAHGGGEGAGVELALLRWGLVSDKAKGAPIINFRSEGRRFQTGRCLVPATAFYEFVGARHPKARWRFEPAAGGFFCFAGLWRTQDGTERFTLLTTAAGPDIAPYHDRQPVALSEAGWAVWLGGAEEGALLRPSPAGTFAARCDRPAERTPSLFG